MISSSLILTIIVILCYAFLIHLLADFFFQTDEMAKNKSTSIMWLTKHVFMYGLVTSLGWVCFSVFYPIAVFDFFKFIAINVSLHWVTDFVTSKITSHYYKKGDIHNFFVVIGVDQYIHSVILIITALTLILTTIIAF